MKKMIENGLKRFEHRERRSINYEVRRIKPKRRQSIIDPSLNVIKLNSCHWIIIDL